MTIKMVSPRDLSELLNIPVQPICRWRGRDERAPPPPDRPARQVPRRRHRGAVDDQAEGTTPGGRQ